MRKIEVMLYEFSELSEAAKERAIERFRDFNVDYEWWSSSYDGMAECGVVIHEFDTHRGTIKSEIDDEYETAQTIISDWGETSILHVLSKQFLLDREALVKKYGEGNQTDGYDDDLNYLERDYHHDLNEEMWKMLREEYEYLTSDEAVIESIEINKYEFTEDGTLA
jgi:hypothetical protein